MAEKRPIYTFIALTFLFSSVFYALIIVSGKLGGAGGLYAAGIMWCPGLAALITCRLRRIPIRTLGWTWGDTKYQFGSYLVPLAYSLLAYLLVWVSGWGGFPNHDFIQSRRELVGIPGMPPPFAVMLFLLLNASFGFVWSCASAIGEEIGWRGFLVPRLLPLIGFTRTSILSGLIWAIWHYPVLLFADYNSGTPAWYGLTCFTILLVATSFIYTWFRMRSGSLWTGVFLHASHNLFIQSIFTPLTAKSDRSAYAIDEFGFMLPLVATGFALWFWRNRKSTP